MLLLTHRKTAQCYFYLRYISPELCVMEMCKETPEQMLVKKMPARIVFTHH